VNTPETGRRLQLHGVLRVGDEVRTTNRVKPTCLASRTGRVVELNKRDNEVGVRFAAVSCRDDLTTWFGTSELEAGSSPHKQACASMAPRTGIPAAKASLGDYRAYSLMSLFVAAWAAPRMRLALPTVCQLHCCQHPFSI